MGAVPVNKGHVSRRQDETYESVDPLSAQNCKAETLGVRLSSSCLPNWLLNQQIPLS